MGHSIGAGGAAPPLPGKFLGDKLVKTGGFHRKRDFYFFQFGITFSFTGLYCSEWAQNVHI